MLKTIDVFKTQIEKLKFIEVSRITDKELSLLQKMTNQLGDGIEAQRLWRGICISPVIPLQNRLGTSSLIQLRFLL